MSARRLAFVLPHLRPGGAERAVLNWCTALDRARFAPMLLLKRAEGAFLEALPADVPVIDMGGARARRLPGRIAALLDRHGVGIAYSATSAMNLALCGAARRRPATRIVISEHSSPAAYLAEAKWPALRRAAMRRLYPRAQALFVPTAAIGAELSRLVPGLPPTTTIPNPVIDAAAARAVPRPPRGGDALRLVSAGRLVPAKAFDVLIDACALLHAHALPFTLDIYGEGEGERALRERIAAHGLGDRVRLRGHVPDLAAPIAAADLFVLASRREGFGNVLVEAMAVGTPVLSAASAGPRLLIRDGIDGRLVPVEDAAALADAMAAIAADPAAAARRAEAARATADRYDIGRSADRLADALERL